MLAEADLDLVSVVVRSRHRGPVMAALDAGKHVYCEWPLGANLAEAEAMADLAREKKVHAMVGLQARGDPAVRYLRELIADDYVGDVLAVSMTMFTGGALERPQSRTWDRDKTKGVSALTVRPIHTMDVLCWCHGDFVELSGKVTTQVKQWRVTETNEMVDVDTPDNVTVNGVLRSGRDRVRARRHRALQRVGMADGDLWAQGHDPRVVEKDRRNATPTRLLGRPKRRGLA